MLTTVGSDRLASLGERELSDALERGGIVFFPTCPIELPPEDDLAYLRDVLPTQIQIKNVSYHPESDRLHGVKDAAPRARVHEILTGHAGRVQRFLRKTMPGITEAWTIGTTSFRPVQEKGRDLKPHASNELIHFDAQAYGATDGDRILRFFVNVNPSTDRVWSSKGTFPDVFERYGEDAGVVDLGQLRRGLGDRLRGSVLRGIAKLGLPEAVLADSSPYDRAMRRFHNYMKDTPAFQAADDAYQEVSFPPFSAWMVLTDMVSHASVSGQHALVDTFVLRLEACRLPELAPINILKTGSAA